MTASAVATVLFTSVGRTSALLLATWGLCASAIAVRSRVVAERQRRARRASSWRAVLPASTLAFGIGLGATGAGIALIVLAEVGCVVALAGAAVWSTAQMSTERETDGSST